MLRPSLLALCCLVPSLARAESPQFRIERPRVPGRVLGIHLEDWNGDGKRDLAVVFTVGQPPSTKRRIALFFDHGSSYSAEPDQVIDAPRGAAFLDFADVDGDGRRALVFGDGIGLGAFRLDASGARFDETPKRLFAASDLLSLVDDEELPFFDVARDWDGDGKQEILLPLLAGTAVYQRGADGNWTRSTVLRLAPHASYAIRSELYEPRLRNFSARATFTLPELVTADYDGDGKLDLCAVVEDLLQVHRGGAATVFSPIATARILVGVRSEAEQLRGNAHVHTTVRDLDGDGVADLAVNKIAGGLGQMRGQTGIYYGKKGGGFERPAQVIDREGYSGSLAFADLDGDGKPDLVMPHVGVGLGEMARVLMSKKMLIGWEVRRNLGRGFSAAPEAVREVDFPVDYSALADIDGPYPSVAGDFNGDGKADFIAAHGPDALAVFLGGGKTLLADTPRAVVRVTPSKYYQVADLDGDKLADVVVFYRFREALAGQLVVLRNTGRGW
jgi:hypothetical protein